MINNRIHTHTHIYIYIYIIYIYIYIISYEMINNRMYLFFYKDVTKLQALQNLLKPYLLRRMKDDVEKSLKPKEETIIEGTITSSIFVYFISIYFFSMYCFISGVDQYTEEVL